MAENETNAEQSAPPAPKQRIRRGAKYIGENGAHLPGVPAADLTPEEVAYYFGDTYEQRRHAIEVAFKHLYTWDPPKDAGHKPEDDE